MNETTEQTTAPLIDETQSLVDALEATLPRYFRALRRAIERAEGPSRLTMQQIRCLQAIDSSPNGETLTSRLARQMSVSAPSISSMIDGLVDRALVTRLPDPVNRRQIRLMMTEDGRELLLRYDGVVNEHLGNLLGPLTPRSRRRLHQSMLDLRSLLDALDAADDLAAED